MDSLKSAIADKVLEISSSDRYDMKERLDKINRFRDFVNACQVLIEKYPAVESELRRMVEAGDFDTKTASIRVDTIIRLSEKHIDLDESDNYTGENPSEAASNDAPITDQQSAPLPYRDLIIENNTVKPRAGQAKDTAKKGMQVVVTIAIIVALIFAIVFVIQNFETVLFGLGILAILIFIVWIIIFNKKKKEPENEEEEE